MEHIVAALFDVPSEAYQAFTELKGFPQNDETRIAQAVLLKKENGVISVADAFDPLRQVGSDMLTGTLVGSVLGILGGPLGMLFGAGVGAWVGRLRNGDVAIIALAQERIETPLDEFFGRVKTLVARWDAWRIQQEVVDAEQVQADLHERVRAELRTRRSEERHEMFEEFRQSLRQKFEDLKAMFK